MRQDKMGFDPTILSRLGEATADELAAAIAAIQAEATPLREQTDRASITRLGELADANKLLRAAHATALAQQEAARAGFSDIAAPVPTPAPVPVEPVEQTAQPAQPAPVETPPPAPEPAPVEQNAEPAPAEPPLGGVQASATAPTTVGRSRVYALAASGFSNVAVGTELDEAGLADAFATRYQAVYGSGRMAPGTERYTVATVHTEYPEERRLTRDGGRANARKINDLVRQVQAPQPLTAAGICGPLETIYDIPTVGSTQRPVRDALMRVGVERGGIQYRPMLAGVGQTGGIGTWTVANDNADPLVPKTCVEIDCPSVVQASVEATYMCLEFANFTTRFDPEYFRAVQESQQIAHARFAENKLLTQLTTASKTVYSTELLGAVSDSIATIEHMLAYFRSVHRLSENIPLRWILPQWLLNVMRTDLARRMAGDGLDIFNVSAGQIEAWFAARNVRVTWHLDGIDPPDITTPDPDIVVPNQIYSNVTTGSPVPPFPLVVSTLLFVEGTWMYLDGGTLDLGVVRDSTLNGRNRFQVFSEEWNAVAFRGLETFHLVLRVRPSGTSAATVSTASAN